MQTIFRVVGGFSNRKTMVEYEIIPYPVIKEYPSNYVLERNGKQEVHKKRTTSNTQWFTKLDDALSKLCERLDIARASISDSYERISDVDFSGSDRWISYIYVVRFHKEKFEIFQYEIDSGAKTRKGGIKTVERNLTGKNYLYPHESQPHNPTQPYERWMSKDLPELLRVVKEYADSRLHYLHRTKMHWMDWVRIFERESNGK